MAIFKNLLTTTKKKVVAMLSGRKAQHVMHGDGFPRSTRGRQWSIEDLILDGRFGKGAGITRSNVLLNILLKIQTIEILLK